MQKSDATTTASADVKTAKPQGFGSIWNNNSWFFEEKNYTKFAKNWLTENVCKIKETREDAEVSLYELKSIEGDASVAIRKQKQLFIFDFNMEVYFIAKRTNPDDYDEEDE